MFDDHIPGSGFDLRKGERVEYQSPLPDDTPDTTETKKDDLDKPENVRRFLRLRSLYHREIDRQAENRMEMATDEDFYDNIQWTQEDADVLRERGQDPLVYNVISNSVNWVIGSEKRGRIDFKVLPRRKGEGGPAQRKTELLKYLSDVNRTPFHRSRAFEDTVKVGLGWLEDGLGEDGEGELISSRYESWRNVLWDSASTDMMLKDCRYIFRTKWMDFDFAAAMFPKRSSLIEDSSQDSLTYGASDIEDGDEAMDSQEQSLESGIGGDTTDYTRRRVRMVEVWFRVPVTVKKLRGGDFSGEIFDSNHPAHIDQLQRGKAEVREQIVARMHVAIFTSKGLCWYSESPYNHNEFPFTPIWGYRRGRDNLPYGMIRTLRDIQADINKRASKALAILSSNKVIMEEGAVQDIDAFTEEISRPDAVIVKKKGAELDINADRELAAGHIQMMQQGISMIQQASGVTDELLGRKTNASSGIAIQARQEQGSLATAKFFDNLRLANQVQGEKQLSLVQQYFTEEKSFRITNTRGTPEYVTINDGLPENDIIRTKADFIISEEEWRASMRQAQLAELLDVVQKLAPVAPQVVMVMLDLIVEAMDIPSREELVSRIRQVTGMRDPDAEEPTPEEIQRAQQAQKEQQMKDAMFGAELANKQADAAKKQAEAQKAGVAALLTQAQTTNTNVMAQNTAADAALKIAATPAVAPVADTLLNEAGFISRTEQESNMAQAARAQEAEVKAQQEQQMAAEQQQVAQEQQQQQMAGQNPAAQQQPGIGMPPNMNQ